MTDVTNQVRTVASSTGLDKLAGDLDKVSASQTRAASTAKDLNAATDLRVKATANVSNSVARFTQQHDALTKAMAQVERGEKLVVAQRAAGLPVTDGFTRALQNAKARVEELSKAHEVNEKATSLNRMQMLETTHVVKALTDEIVAGGQPLRALAMEGGRIAEIFSMGNGGVGGTLRAFGGVLGGLATSWVGVGVGIAGAMGLAVAALASFESRQNSLARSLSLTGRGSGLTLAGLNNIASNAANAPNSELSIGQAQGLAGQFASTGAIGGQIMPQLLGVSAQYARATGQELSAAGQELAAAFADPVKGAETLDAKMGLLDDRTRQLIRSLTAQGDIVSAQGLLFDRMSKVAEAAGDRTWTLARAWDAVKRGIAGAVDAVGAGIGSVVDPTKSQTRDSLIAQRSQLEASNYFGANNGAIAVLNKSIEDLTAQIEAANKKAAEDAADAERRRQSSMAGDVVRSVLPDLARQQQRDDQMALLRRTIDNGSASSVFGGADLVGRALQQLQVISANADPLRRIAQDSKLAIDGINAESLAETAYIAARKAELAVLRESGDVVKAAASAEAARNEEIARARDAIDKANIDADRQLKYAGLSPYERARAQARDSVDDLKEKYGGGAGRLTDSERAVASGVAPMTRLATAADAAATALFHIGSGAVPAGGGLPLFAGGASGPIAGYIRQQAAMRGIDPNIAVRVAQSEGLNTYTGDNGTSFGPFQLHYGGGLGDVFTRKTHLDASDPSTVLAQISFALDQAKAGGWGPWHGAAKVGIGRWDGINGAGGGAGNDNAPPSESDFGGILKSKLGAIDIENIDRPFQDAMMSIAGMSRQADVLIATFGQSKAALAGANEAEKLREQYIREGLDPTKQAADLQKKLNDNIAEVGKSAAEAAQRLQDAQDYQQRVTSGLDTVRGDSTGLFSSLGHAIGNRKNVGDAFRQWGLNLGGQMIDAGANSLTSIIFGGKGKPGGGLLGDTLGGLIGGKGAITAATATVNAGAVVVNGGIGGALGDGAAGATGGGGLGGLLGSIFSGFHFAGGGIMTGSGPMALRRYASGGVASSPQLAMYGEGSRPEAFVPLPDGRKIPVSLQGSAPPVSFGGHTIVVQGAANDESLAKMRAELAAANDKQWRDFHRNMGNAQARWQGRYA